MAATETIEDGRPRSQAVSDFQRTTAEGDVEGNGTVFRNDRSRKSQCPRSARRRLHVFERNTRPALRDRRHHGQLDGPKGGATGWPADLAARVRPSVAAAQTAWGLAD